MKRYQIPTLELVMIGKNEMLTLSIEQYDNGFSGMNDEMEIVF